MSQLYDPLQDSTPLPQFVEAKTANRKARTAFWRGSIFGALLATGAFVASSAWGETITIGSVYVNGQQQQGTTVTLAPSDVPGQIATVTLDNKHVNQGRDTGQYFVGIEGLVVEAQFVWDANPLTGADQITVIPPEGIVCVPVSCEVTVMEGFQGVIVLLDWQGM